MTTQAYNDARKKNTAVLTGAVDITLPAFDDLPEVKIFAGTSFFECDGNEYKPLLPELPVINNPRGLAQDTASFKVNDPNSIWASTFNLYRDVIEDTAITTKECLFTAENVFESEKTLVGFLERFSINEKDYSLDFEAISDISRTGKIAGGRILSQRFCAANFNKNGLKNPEIDPCGWTTPQGGNPIFCTHKREGVDGCIAHNNSHRFYAIEGITSGVITTYTGGTIGGWEYGENPCFTSKMPVNLVNGTTPIYKVKKGDLAWSFDKNGNVAKKKVIDVRRDFVDQILILEFEHGQKIETRPDHLFLINHNLFKKAGLLESGDTVLRYVGADWISKPVWKIYLEDRRTAVYNLSIEDYHTYFVDWYGVHNTKPLDWPN